MKTYYLKDNKRKILLNDYFIVCMDLHLKKDFHNIVKFRVKECLIQRTILQ